MPMGGDIQDWFKSLPLFTRYWFGGTILFTLLGRFGLLQPAWLVLYLEPLIHRFQVSMLQFMIIAYCYPGKNDILFRMLQLHFYTLHFRFGGQSQHCSTIL